MNQSQLVQSRAFSFGPISRVPFSLRAAVCAVALVLGTATVPFASSASAQTVPAATPVPTLAEQHLYGTSQWGSFPINNPGGSATASFDGQTANMVGPFGRRAGNNWTFGTLQRTTLTTISSASIEVRWAQSGWKDDELVFEYSIDNWTTARPVKTFGAGSPPPTALQTSEFAGLERVLDTPAKVNQVQFRLRSGQRKGGSEEMTIQIDQVRLVVKGS